MRRAGQAGESTCDCHYQKDIAFGRNTCILCRFGVLPNHTYLIAKRRAGDDEPVNHHGDKSEKDANIDRIGKECERIELWQKFSQGLVVEEGKGGQLRLGRKSKSLGDPVRSCEWKAI